MQLLLFLSALLAGLTGAFASDRVAGVGGHHAGTTITRAAEAVAETVVAAATSRADAPVAARIPLFTHAFAVHAEPLAIAVRLTTGRWLE